MSKRSDKTKTDPGGRGAFPPFIPRPSGTSGKKTYEPDPKPTKAVKRRGK